MTTTTQTRTCRRCHGTGHEPPGPAYDERQREFLAELTELGAARAKLRNSRSYMSSEGRPEYDRVVAEIRNRVKVGTALGIRTMDLMTAIGVSSAGFYKNFS